MSDKTSTSSPSPDAAMPAYVLPKKMLEDLGPIDAGGVIGQLCRDDAGGISLNFTEPYQIVLSVSGENDKLALESVDTKSKLVFNAAGAIIAVRPLKKHEPAQRSGQGPAAQTPDRRRVL